MFTNKTFQEITVIFVSEVKQKYTVTCISSIFSDTMEVATNTVRIITNILGVKTMTKS